MGNKMLIDATHPEETRVVVLRGNRVEEFDFESASRKQLRGNIYLAKVTRVEPSLQAAFVNYGGNRHGFLAFSEIHPDYYQLPMAERQALKEEEFLSRSGANDASEGDAAQSDTDDDYANQPSDSAYENSGDDESESDDGGDYASQTAALEAALPATRYSKKLNDEADDAASEDGAKDPESDEIAGPAQAIEPGSEAAPEAPLPEDVAHAVTDADVAPSRHDDDHGNGDRDENGELDHVESVGSEDALEELPQRHKRRRRSYKIQEVIKRGQILLVQVVKEERGNKGAALTTYLSLAGRYTVLMPNTASGGGISRKIASPADRKRLREIATELDVPDGMGLIIRTAGAARTKTEIKRDYEYLLRLWENVRDLTLDSTAPCLVYEEGDLIKRSIRDLYNREIDEVLVAGDDAYRDAKDFMRMLMPSHAKNVQPYRDPEPVFTRYEVERQLNGMFSPQVTLPSGGYVIINQTEALVSVDVNSGKSTREFSIEDTALKTNLEAAEEISRQLRLRDLAGLVVIDFIDMEERRNNRAVERKLKECLRNDRARIQVGRISHFGLMEMSRQRIRTGMVEGSTTQCPHCQGTGFVRSTESVALSVLRSIEDWLRTHTPCDLSAVCAPEVALYILNQKRTYLNDIELRHGVTISVLASDRMHGSNFYIEKISAAAAADGTQATAVSQSDKIILPFDTDQEDAGDDQGRRSRKRRRRRRGRNGEDQDQVAGSRRGEAGDDSDWSDADDAPDQVAESAQSSAGGDTQDGDSDEKPRRRSRRRGRRGGRSQRGNRSANVEATAQDQAEIAEDHAQSPDAFEADRQPPDAPAAEPANSSADAAQPEEAREPETPQPAETAEPPAEDVNVSDTETSAPEAAEDDTRSFRGARRRGRTRRTNGQAKPNGHEAGEHASEEREETVEPDQPREAVDDTVEAEGKTPPPPKPRGAKRGWWQRRTP